MTMPRKDKNTFGLSDRDMKTCHDIFDKYPEITHVLIFGSRAKGKHHLGSDVDLAIMNRLDDPTVIRKIKTDFDESSLPYTVDLVHHPTLDPDDLKKHIDRVGRLFFQRDLH